MAFGVIVKSLLRVAKLMYRMLGHMRDDPDSRTGTDNNNNKMKNLLWKRRHAKSCRTGKNRYIEYSYHIQQQLALPYISNKDFIIIGVLGGGRNGSCFRVKWNGQEYAMKQYDTGRDGCKNYNNELLAYMLLRDVWGILVPRPIFLSESCFIKYIGYQLGREPNEDDDESMIKPVLLRIQEEFGIRNNDHYIKSLMIFIPDTNCCGGERVVASDFDHWEFV
jgi:hypothetical protein